MQAGKLIPSNFQGKLCKIKIQNSEDKHPFVYFGVALCEDEENIYVQMGKTELFFRKQHIASVEFLEKSKSELSKSDIVQQEKECKVVYKIGGKTQVVSGNILGETDSYLYVKLTDKQYRMIMRHCVISITYAGDKQGQKKVWTDKVRTGRKSDNFSYGKWWKHLDVKECDNK